MDLVTGAGATVATGAIGFARVPRRQADPVKPPSSATRITTMFDGSRTLTRPLREEAGIVVLDSRAGALEMQVTPGFARSGGNPPGRHGGPPGGGRCRRPGVDQVRPHRRGDRARPSVPGADRCRTRPVGCRLLGKGPDAPIEVELFDTSSDRLVTLVYARTAVVRPSFRSRSKSLRSEATAAGNRRSGSARRLRLTRHTPQTLDREPRSKVVDGWALVSAWIQCSAPESFLPGGRVRASEMSSIAVCSDSLTCCPCSR